MTQSVAPAYTHADKQCAPRASIVVSGAALKWYDIGFPEQPVPETIRELARTYLAREAPELGGELGFVLLHRCGHGDFYFLLVQTWLSDNEIWKTTLYKDRNDPDFLIFPLNLPHKATFCVWEQGVVWHEVGAWKRYLRSARDAGGKSAYLEDLYEGAV
ncbi:MAG: hypothetical protein K2X34_07340 [Hyphomonadaceae bacterium]|nr:hypothetical protein [Hyphomonadaceae bacterium]